MEERETNSEGRYGEQGGKEEDEGRREGHMESDRVRGRKWGDGKRGIETERGSKERVQKIKRGQAKGGEGEKMRARERSSTKDSKRGAKERERERRGR